MRLALVDVLEQPAAVGISLGVDDRDRLGGALIGRLARVAEVVEAAQNVVEVPGRERELEPGRIDHFAARLSSEEASLEQVLLTAATRRCDLRRAADRPLVLEQTLEDVDRGPE